MSFLATNWSVICSQVSRAISPFIADGQHASRVVVLVNTFRSEAGMNDIQVNTKWDVRHRGRQVCNDRDSDMASLWIYSKANSAHGGR